VTAAQSGLATATQDWQAATSAASSGDLATAMRQANDVKTRVVVLMKSLNMTLPPGVGGN
jgi:hypothetical protein